MTRLTAFVAAVALLIAPSLRAQQAPRVFVSVDMEGIWGVVHGDQTSAASPEYGLARKWLVDDVNAVIAGLLDAGAGEIVVNDSHASMRNIIADALDPRASLISGSPKPLSMMQGIDTSYDAVVLVGYHARAGTAAAILDHTISSSTVRAVTVNGRELPELGLNGAIAGAYGVPVILVTGDTETCAQAKSTLGEGVLTVAVKDAITRTAARMYPAHEARRRLRETARDALGRRGAIAPYRLTAPYAFEVEFHNSLQAEPALLLPGVRRLNARAVTFSTQDYLEGFGLLRAIITLAGTT